MTEISVSRSIDARPEVVWGLVTDVTAVPRILRSVEAVERIDGWTGFDVGARWRETRRLLGRLSTADVEVVAVQPGRAFTVEAAQSGTEYRSTVTVIGAPGATSTVTLQLTARPRTAAARVVAAIAGGLRRRATHRMLAADLEDLQLAASTTAATAARRSAG